MLYRMVVAKGNSKGARLSTLESESDRGKLRRIDEAPLCGFFVSVIGR